MKDFPSLAAQLKQLPNDDFRKEENGYIEFVMKAQNLSQLYPLLEDFFGPPFKPAGVAPSREALDRAAHYGGIEKHQTLYYLEAGGLSSCAMIWPWNDKTRVTVKVAQGKVSA